MMMMVVVVHLSLIKVISNAAKTDKSVQKVLSDGSDSPDFSWTFEIGSNRGPKCFKKDGRKMLIEI